MHYDEQFTYHFLIEKFEKETDPEERERYQEYITDIAMKICTANKWPDEEQYFLDQLLKGYIPDDHFNFYYCDTFETISIILKSEDHERTSNDI